MAGSPCRAGGHQDALWFRSGACLEAAAAGTLPENEGRRSHQLVSDLHTGRGVLAGGMDEGRRGRGKRDRKTMSRRARKEGGSRGGRYQNVKGRRENKRREWRKEILTRKERCNREERRNQR